MKRILCLTDGFSLGGAERQLIGLAYFLQCKGYEVELCSYIKRSFYDFLIKSYGLKSTCLDVNGGRISKFLAVWRYARKGHYDWIIAYKDGATFAACVLKLLCVRTKVIVSERNTNILRSRYDDFKFLLYSLADYIVPNSHSQQNFIEFNYTRLRNKIVTITNYTDTDYFKPLVIPTIEENHELNIMVAARIAEQKNILNFLEVVRRLRDNGACFSIKWYGNASSGEEEYEYKCKKYIEDYKLETYFSFRPATNDILHKYQLCDVFCLPSLYEGYPNVICEAMSCGKPILCSNVCENPLIVEDNVNGYLFNPTDKENMYEIIYQFIKLPLEKRNEMGNKSRFLAERKFSNKVFTDKYIKLIESK